MDHGSVDYQAFTRTVEETAATLESRPVLSSVEAPTDVDALLDDLKSRVAVRRVQLRSQLENAARESRGFLNRTKFYRILAYAGFDFIPGDVKAIDDAFLGRDDNVDFQSFLDRVEPLAAKAPIVDVDAVIARLRTHLTERRTTLSRYFAAFDREKSGTVSVAQVISAFSSVDFHPTTGELTELCHRYGNGRFIEWKVLSSDVEVEPVRRPIEALPVRVQRDVPTPEITGILRRLYQASKRCGAKIRDDMIRADIRKCGLLSSRAFKDVLESLPVRIGTPEITVALRTYFKPGTEMILYTDFCDDLEQYGPDAPRPKPVDLPPIDDIDPEEAERSAKALRMIKAAFRSRRVTPEELFVYHDSTRAGTIAISSFRNVIKPVLPFLTDDLVQQLQNDFRDKRQPEKFNYRRLCGALADVNPDPEDLDEVAEIQREITGENDGVQFISNMIREKITARRKSIYDLFLDVRRDSIPVEEFRDRIAGSGIILSENDIQKIVRQYGRQKNREIHWESFCIDVNESAPIARR
jgi:Ca2+-binding EF-hand superfamily protein